MLVIKHDNVSFVRTPQYSLIEILKTSDFVEIDDCNLVKNIDFKLFIWATQHNFHEKNLNICFIMNEITIDCDCDDCDANELDEIFNSRKMLFKKC